MRPGWLVTGLMLVAAHGRAQTPGSLTMPPSRNFGGGPPSTQVSPQPVAPVAPEAWVPGHSVRLQALDKVNAQATALTVKVGQTVVFGSLTIDAKACLVRPPDRPADAAAFLAVTDAHPDSPRFDGWMLANEPAMSMMQNPVYDLRVTGCG